MLPPSPSPAPAPSLRGPRSGPPVPSLIETRLVQAPSAFILPSQGTAPCSHLTRALGSSDLHSVFLDSARWAPVALAACVTPPAPCPGLTAPQATGLGSRAISVLQPPRNLGVVGGQRCLCEGESAGIFVLRVGEGAAVSTPQHPAGPAVPRPPPRSRRPRLPSLSHPFAFREGKCFSQPAPIKQRVYECCVF